MPKWIDRRCPKIAMHIGRAQTSETALKKIIVAIKDTLQKGSGKIAPLVKLSDMIILSPGSTGGSLFFVQIFRELGFDDLPTIVETPTVTYGCRAKRYKVEDPVECIESCARLCCRNLSFVVIRETEY